MFPQEAMRALVHEHRETWNQLAEVERQLNERFYDMEEAVRAIILSAVCGEPLLLVGSPGTGKSLLIRDFCRLLGLKVAREDGQRDADYFEYLLTPFTEPSELFGFLDVKSLAAGDRKIRRLEEGMLQNARVVYLDEVFNASSAILNSLLAVMNEGIFHDYGGFRRVKMKCLFAATNDLKTTRELRAFADRFTLRCEVRNAEPKTGPLGNLLERGWRATYMRGGAQALRPFPDLLDGVLAFREALRDRTAEGLGPGKDEALVRYLAGIVDFLRERNYSEMSNRRLVKLTGVMLIHALYRSAIEGQKKPALGIEEIHLIYKYFLDRNDPELELDFNRVKEEWKELQYRLS